MYHGVREAEPVAQFAVKVLEVGFCFKPQTYINRLFFYLKKMQEVITADETLGKEAFSRVGAGSDLEADGTQESIVHTPGCRIEG